jgi:uncharacterized protein
MRDGVHLFTSVYVPKDSSHSYPFLINRTPYSVGPYGVDLYRKQLGPSPEFDKAGYIFVFQDVRGRYMSEGHVVEMRPHIDNKKSKQDVDDSSDLYDTIDWLLKNVPNNNGNAGIWGISYPGFFTSASIIDSHPALKAASPQAPMTDLFMGDDAYHGGAFMLAANFGFYVFFKPQQNPQLPPKDWASFDWGTKDAYEFYLQTGALRTLRKFLEGKSALWDDQVKHDTYDDYWKVRNLAPHMKNIHCAVLTVGGWFDAEDLQGPFSTFHSIDKNNPGIFNALVIGPWVHGGWARYDGEHLGRVDFASNTGEYYRKTFCSRSLSNTSRAMATPNCRRRTSSRRAQMYGGNIPRGRRKMRSPKLSTFTPTAALVRRARSETPSFDEYVSDPAKPVPFVNYAALMCRRSTCSQTSASPTVAPTCWFMRLRLAGRRDARRPNLAATFRFDQWHRFRLGRKTD